MFCTLESDFEFRKVLPAGFLVIAKKYTPKADLYVKKNKLGGRVMRVLSCGLRVIWGANPEETSAAQAGRRIGDCVLPHSILSSSGKYFITELLLKCRKY